MAIQTIIVPYDSGQRDVRMGAGPMRLLADAVEPLLRAKSLASEVVTVEATPRWDTDIGTAFALNRIVASHVQLAVEAGKLPLVLSGNCNGALGTISGIATRPLGIIWLDAHGDFNTPETTPSGYFDGMGLAVAAGLCWKDLAGSIPGFRAVAGENILHIGARELDAAELRNMEQARVGMLDATAFGSSAFAEALQRLRARTSSVYLHLDVDVIDRAEVHANEFSPPGGLSVAVLADALRLISSTFEIAALGVASYDPACDPEGRAPAAVRQLLAPILLAR